jgi:hypothetical protein
VQYTNPLRVGFAFSEMVTQKIQRLNKVWDNHIRFWR